jgi:hypothetical protein
MQGGSAGTEIKHRQLKRLTQNAIAVTQNTVAITQYTVTVTVAAFFHSGHRRDHSEAVMQV